MCSFVLKVHQILCQTGFALLVASWFQWGFTAGMGRGKRDSRKDERRNDKNGICKKYLIDFG